jgi:hypothetical protein
MRGLAGAIGAALSLLSVTAVACEGSSSEPRERDAAAALPPISPYEDSGPPRNAMERRARARLQHQQRRVIAPLDEPSSDAVERAVTAEAQRRFATGELRRRVSRTECDPPRELPGDRVGYTCLAVTASGAGIMLGQPVVANASLERRTVTFCFRSHSPGEMSSLTDVRVALKSPCRDVLHAPVRTSGP